MPMAEKAAKSLPDFGSKMKRAREERGVTLRHIADVTKISVSALEALERNDISRLPGGIFSRAFVRSYALEIGLDPEQTVREFLARFPDDSVTAGSRYVAYDDSSSDEPRRRRLSGVLITVLIVASIIGAILVLIALEAIGPRAAAWKPALGLRCSISSGGAKSRATSACWRRRAPLRRARTSNSDC